VFTFVVIAYFGAMVLLPLDAIALLVKLMGVVGIHGFIGALIAIPAVGYLCLMVYKTPGLCKMVVDTGVDLIKIGKLKVEAFNEIVDAVKA
jgi:choline-glycine betaine transporter